MVCKESARVIFHDKKIILFKSNKYCNNVLIIMSNYINIIQDTNLLHSTKS